MKLTPIEQSITTATLLDAMRRGQVFGIEIKPIGVNFSGWRIYAEVILPGYGLHRAAVSHQGNGDYESRADAHQALLEALEPDDYRKSTHLADGNTTFCSLGHVLGSFPDKVESIKALEAANDRCPRCWINWHARARHRSDM